MIRHRVGAAVGLFSLAFFSAILGGPADRLSSGPVNLIIPNIDDDNGDGLPDGQAPIASGMSDEEVLQLRLRPKAPLPEGAVLRIIIEGPWAKFARASVLKPSSGGFQVVQGPIAVDPGEATRNGVTIGVEALDFADAGRPPALNQNVRFETKEGLSICEESVGCTVVPFLLSCCLDSADSVHVVKTKLTERFVADLTPLVGAAGVKLEALEDPALRQHDIWVQDATEIGYATDGRRVMRVALHGNRGEKLDDLFAKKFLGKDRGVVFKGNDRGESAQWIDWFGNLEVSPPLRVNGRDFLIGRAYSGKQGERAMHPDVIGFLEAQGIQAPLLWLDTSWLIIGHVDETVSWVPSKVGQPYRMLMPSARLAVEILRTAQERAPGCLMNRGTGREGDAPGEFERPVAETLNNKALMDAQEFVQNRIDAVRRTLQDGLGVADEDIIEIPVLFSASWDRYPGRYGAETVNMVNSLLLGDVLIVPDPHGPLVDGKDVLLEAVKDRLEPLGIRVWAVDDFYPYHRYGGEVHCGTNATRSPAAGR